MLIVLYRTEKELDIREGKIRQKLSELASFRFCSKSLVDTKCMIYLILAPYCVGTHNSDEREKEWTGHARKSCD